MAIGSRAGAAVERGRHDPWRETVAALLVLADTTPHASVRHLAGDVTDARNTALATRRPLNARPRDKRAMAVRCSVHVVPRSPPPRWPGNLPAAAGGMLTSHVRRHPAPRRRRGRRPQAAAELLPLVYDELRKLAAAPHGRRDAGPDPPGHRPGPRGVPAAGRRGRSSGTAAATSSPRRPRPCAASSWSHARPSGRPSAAATGAVEVELADWPTRRPAAGCWPCDEALDRLAATEPTGRELVSCAFFGGMTRRGGRRRPRRLPRHGRAVLGVRPRLAPRPTLAGDTKIPESAGILPPEFRLAREEPHSARSECRTRQVAGR